MRRPWWNTSTRSVHALSLTRSTSIRCIYAYRILGDRTDAPPARLRLQITEFGAAVDPVAEKRLLRKLDFIILPQVTLIFLLNFIDRSAVGNANVAGFSRDLGLSVPKK